MAMLYITELDTLGTPNEGGNAQIADACPPIAEQTITYTSSAQSSFPFNQSTRFVRIETDTTCSLAFGPGPTAQTVSSSLSGTAAAGTLRLYANASEYFAVKPGHKVSVITTS